MSQQKYEGGLSLEMTTVDYGVLTSKVDFFLQLGNLLVKVPSKYIQREAQSANQILGVHRSQQTHS